MPGISISKENGKDWLSVPGGIATLAGYFYCENAAHAGAKHPPAKSEGVPLREYDESEYSAVQESGTQTYRRRHNKMTKAFGRMPGALSPEQGPMSNNMYDIRLRDYDGAGHDLLIEAKPDPNKGSLRIAIGQLYDYRRLLSNRGKTDLAVLTIGKPDQSYIELLVSDLGIT